MASIFTGLAFMHGHIVNKDLVLRLGAPERARVSPSATASKPRKDSLRRANRKPLRTADPCGCHAACC